MWRFLAIALFGLVAFGAAHETWGAMSSTNYYIYADDFSMGGGLSTGTIYSLQDTIGQSPIDISTSTSYEIRAGYQYSVLGELSMSISDTSVDLGTLTGLGATSSAQTVVTVTADPASSFILSSATTLTFKAARSTATASSTYGQNITLTASANF